MICPKCFESLAIGTRTCPKCRRVAVFKAQPTGDQEVPDLEIVACMPALLGAQYDEDAEAIARALMASLPGGTLDRLLGKLLLAKASHLRVPRWSPSPGTPEFHVAAAALCGCCRCPIGELPTARVDVDGVVQTWHLACAETNATPSPVAGVD